MTDIGSSKLFADAYKKQLKFVREMGLYFFFNGSIWVKDINSIYAKRLAKKFAIKTVELSNAIDNEKLRETAVKYYAKFNGFNQREKLIRDAQSVYIIDYSEFDKKPNLYNCINGTVNLDTGELHEHDPKDMLTQISNVTYEAGAKCDRWEQFIDEVMEGDEQSKKLLQMISGYCLSGFTRFECFFILYGSKSRNGKGTYNSVMHKMHGDYSKVIGHEVLEVKNFRNNGDAPNESIASLAGARYVCVSEPGENFVLNSDLIKQLTGNDPVRARFLRQNSFIYIPQFKIVINSNYLPKVLDPTVFASDRLMLIDFPVHYEAGKRDLKLKEKLTNKQSLSGIFNWCLKGYKMLQEVEALKIPDKSMKLFGEYLDESDIIQQFIDECLIGREGAHTKFSAVYERYKGWIKENGFFQCNRITLEKRLKCKGLKIAEYCHQKQLFEYDVLPNYLE